MGFLYTANTSLVIYSSAVGMQVELKDKSVTAEYTTQTSTVAAR